MILLRESYRKSRKQTECVWCGEHIIAGEHYRSQSIIYEGDFIYTKYHPECYHAMVTDDIGFEDGFDEGMFKRGTTEPK